MLQKIMDDLSPAQRAAVEIVKTALDCYNSKDGTGLFVGAARYDILATRMAIAAAQVQNLTAFWAKLQQRMLWGVTPKSLDEQIVRVLSADEPLKVLTSLRNETASLVMLARMLHDIDKNERMKRGTPKGTIFADDITDEDLKDDKTFAGGEI